MYVQGCIRLASSLQQTFRCACAQSHVCAPALIFDHGIVAFISVVIYYQGVMVYSGGIFASLSWSTELRRSSIVHVARILKKMHHEWRRVSIYQPRC